MPHQSHGLGSGSGSPSPVPVVPSPPVPPRIVSCFSFLISNSFKFFNIINWIFKVRYKSLLNNLVKQKRLETYFKKDSFISTSLDTSLMLPRSTQFEKIFGIIPIFGIFEEIASK